MDTEAVGFDLWCGCGGWAVEATPREGVLHLIDPSEAIEVAKKLAGCGNCETVSAHASRGDLQGRK